MTAAQAWVSHGVTERLPGGESAFVVDLGAGPPILLLHGFPTWSVDWAGVAPGLCGAARVIAPDFLGFGYSDKPRRRYTIAAQADLVEAVLKARGLPTAALVASDYGVIVAQELLRRRQAGETPLTFSSVTILNAAIVYSQYRPTRAQKLLAIPLVGALFARRVTREAVQRGLAAVSGTPMSEAAFDVLWQGIARRDGHRLSHRLIRYNAERDRKHAVWEKALAQSQAALALIWGIADPVSGAHVLAAARHAYPNAIVTELPGVGHYPHVEAPRAVAEAVLANARRGWRST